jgi:hypothetical protein
MPEERSVKSMKQIRKNNGSIWFLTKIFRKCGKDRYLLIYGIFAYFLSGALTGLVFPMIKKYYFAYGVAASAIPFLFLYFAQIFTRDKSKSRIVVISLVWAVFAYIGTRIGEYPHLKWNLVSPRLSIGINYFNYAAVYLELGKIFNIAATTVLISNYFLCVDKFLIFKSKKKSLNGEEEVNVNYGEGFVSFNLPATIRPHILIYFSAPLILGPAFAFVYFSGGMGDNDRVLFLMLLMLGYVSLIMMLIFDFNKVRLTEHEIMWKEKSRLKWTKLSYKDIKSISVQTRLAGTSQKNIILHANTKRQKHIIQGNFIGNKKLSRIIKIIREKTSNIHMDQEAKNLYYEKIAISSMKGGVTANILLLLMTVNFIATIFVRGIR